MFFGKKTLAGPGSGYITLNVIRVLNIISLLLVVAASFVMLVKTFVVSKFFFFDACSHVVTAGLGIFLIITELPLFRGYIGRNWPLLSINHGFVSLGFLMVILGISILGNLNKAATSQESLGLPFWRIVISSGILSSVLGVANFFASYIFRSKKLGVTARMVRAHGATAAQKIPDTLPFTNSNPTTPQRHRSIRPRSMLLNRSDTLPSYHTAGPNKQSPPQMRSVSNPDRASRLGGLNISGPIEVDQAQFAKFQGNSGIQKPDLAMHPAVRF
ncbi:hypothetical protein MMC25_004243 [Agyrium rufum]|nr:hypothetical protein [Agyrium rufum]